MAKTTMFSQFAKGSGQAPQYSTLAPTPANATGKYVQSFDERAIMVEQPPTTGGGPRGNPKRDSVGNFDAPPRRVIEFDDAVNIRADNQVLVRATPTSAKATTDARPNRLRIYRDASGENL